MGKKVKGKPNAVMEAAVLGWLARKQFKKTRMLLLLIIILSFLFLHY